MIGDIIGWTYLIGFLWFWRYHVGFVMEEVRYGDLEAFDVAMGILGGTLANFIWPLTVGGRTAHVLWTKHMPGDSNLITAIFPAPKEIESHDERRRREHRERERELIEREMAVSKRERLAR